MGFRQMPLKPLYMWAGGKTKLLKKYQPYFPKVSEYRAYVKPYDPYDRLFSKEALKNFR